MSFQGISSVQRQPERNSTEPTRHSRFSSPSHGFNGAAGIMQSRPGSIGGSWSYASASSRTGSLLSFLFLLFYFFPYLHVIPIRFESKIKLWGRTHPKSAARCEEEWCSYGTSFKTATGGGAALLACSITILSAPLGTASAVSVVCIVCMMISSFMTCLFGSCYLWLFGFLPQPPYSDESQGAWLNNLRCGVPGKPSWRDHSFTMAAPFVWLAWSAISFLFFLGTLILNIYNLPSVSNTQNHSSSIHIAAIVLLFFLLILALVHLTLCLFNVVKITRLANVHGDTV